MLRLHKNIRDLENAYAAEKKQVNDKLEQLHELKYQTRRKCDQTYECFLYLKSEMGYSEEANAKMTHIIEEFDGEMNQRIKLQEMKLENYKDELRREYLKQTERIEGDE